MLPSVLYGKFLLGIQILCGVQLCYSGLAVGIYTTNSADACEYVAANCEANILIVENDAQLQKILKVRSRLPHLKAIVQYTGELLQAVDQCYTVSVWH